MKRGVVASVAGRDCRLKSGWYVYAGSAQNGLEGRLRRHLRTPQTRHWHIDSLLAAGAVADIQILATDSRAEECRLARMVRDWPDADPVPGFGASDCRCDSHLTFFPARPNAAITASKILGAVEQIYGQLRQSYVDHAGYDRDPFETLVSCMLSLRTQDPVTHAAAERLFARLRTPRDFADADWEGIAGIIYPVGMYREKARRLIEIARELLDRFDGQTPCEIDELLTLPGVGRKTANLVRSFAFHKPAVCVDTHVHRITNRWGLVRSVAPDDTERELRRILPRKFWIETNAFLVQHGQQVCRPTRPRCAACSLHSWCCYDRLCAERAVLSRVATAPPHPSLKLVDPAPAAKAAGPGVRSPFVPASPASAATDPPSG